MKRRIAALVAVSLLVFAGGCSKASSGRRVTPGVLTLAIPIAPTQLNPILTQNSNENFLAGLMFDELVTMDPAGNDVPDLAAVVPTMANGGISKDGLTITYHLRHGVKWQDGVPLTSKDVKFTWQAIENPANNLVSRTGYDKIKSIDTPNPYTVVLHMKQVYPPAVDTYFAESDSPYRILPSHLLAKYPNLNHIPFNAAPVGSGPFEFVKWMRGDHIELKANPTYFLGAPKLRKIIVKLIPDSNTTAAELRTGEVELAIELTGSAFHDLEDDPALVRTTAKAPYYTAILFNTSRPPLNDVRVRRALVLALDRATITHDNTYGTGQVAVADLSPFYWAFDPALKPVPFDLKEADALLDASGWKLGPSGVRRKDGKPLDLVLAFGQGSDLVHKITAQAQAMLKRVGVNVELKGYDYARLYASAPAGGVYTGGRFDLAMYAWVAGADPDNSSTWLSTSIPPNGNNISRYVSPEMDADQHLALSTFDRAVRKRAYAKIEALLLRDAPGAFLYYLGPHYAYVPQLKGFAPNGISEGWNAYQWSI